MQANWKLLVENSIDGYHASSTHDTCFKYLVWLGADLRRPGRRRHQGSERWPRGAGIPGAPGPRGRQAGIAVRAPKQVIEALRYPAGCRAWGRTGPADMRFRSQHARLSLAGSPPRTTSRRRTPSVPVKPARYSGHVVLVLPLGEVHPRDPAAARERPHRPDERLANRGQRRRDTTGLPSWRWISRSRTAVAARGR